MRVQRSRTVKAIVLVMTLLGLGVHPMSSGAAESFPAATPESQGLSSQALAKLLDVVRGFAAKGDIVGGELLVIKNRHTVLQQTVGLGDLERQQPLKPDTIYCIRSMTKPITGAAVQILIDEGRLDLDDTAAKFLPSFDNDKSRGITIRQLLTHTSGLPFSSLMGSNLDELTSLRDVADKIGNKGPTSEPGSGFQYSDDGADTLGAIVSAITGDPVEVFITKRILEPLGMRDTFPLVGAAGGKLNRFTSAFVGSRGNWVRFWSPQDKPTFSYFLASQGMYATTKDYARFLALYLDEGRAGDRRVLSKAAVERTLEPTNEARAPSGFPKVSTFYGQMMIGYEDANKKLIAFGHNGSDGTWAYAWPEHDLMVLYFTQSRGSRTGSDLEFAIDHLLLGGTAAAPAAQDLTAASAAPYLGLYWLEPAQRPLIVVVDKDRLALEIPWQGLVELKGPDPEHVWSFKGATDSSVKFHRNGDGPAAALDLRGSSPATLKRFEPEGGLPSIDDLLAHRPDRQRAEKLASLGTIRISGSVEMTAFNGRGTFRLLTAGDRHSRMKINVSGRDVDHIVAGDRAWMRLASTPPQELPESMAQSMRLAGWLLATGDWRGEFKETRVLKRVKLNGKPVFLIHAAPAQGRQRLIYLDAENGLTLGYDEVYELPGMGMIGCEVRFHDYRDIGGVQLPFKVTVKYPNAILGTETYQVEKVETSLKVDENPFTFH